MKTVKHLVSKSWNRTSHPMPTADQLVQLSMEVSDCRLCDQSGIELRHAGPMNRGTGSDALIVGIQPGNTELETAEAFSGLGGRRLMEWLERAGLGDSREAILQRVHMTSICKCHITDPSALRQAAQNCHRFLQRHGEVLATIKREFGD